MFQGTSSISLDAKGRMVIPSRHRDVLLEQCGGRITITRSPDGCLLFFPRPVWEDHQAKIAAWPLSARPWQRIYLGSAENVDIDSAGRVLISPELRTAAGLSRKVMFIGMGSHFEIWDASRLEANEAEAVAAGIPDVLKDFSF